MKKKKKNCPRHLCMLDFNTAPHIKAVGSSTVTETRADKRSKGGLESDEVQSCNRKPDPVFSLTGRRADWKRLSSSVSSCLPLCCFSLLMYIRLSRRPPVMPRSNEALMERDGARPPPATLLRLAPINGARLSGHSAVWGRRWWRGKRKWGLARCSEVDESVLGRFKGSPAKCLSPAGECRKTLPASPHPQWPLEPQHGICHTRSIGLLRQTIYMLIFLDRHKSGIVHSESGTEHHGSRCRIPISL